ncbi:hypothetical protein EYF80_042901 [Liparis tanakae]|uniref:Uncharacterized protein n=1 Tax=Liparis tanakae TaxID=230148 RepID=A0A4Z2G190_9TELE|nr:hypothetical protein EYF80_042901 [Liparis tanakae]
MKSRIIATLRHPRLLQLALRRRFFDTTTSFSQRPHSELTTRRSGAQWSREQNLKPTAQIFIRLNHDKMVK